MKKRFRDRKVPAELLFINSFEFSMVIRWRKILDQNSTAFLLIRRFLLGLSENRSEVKRPLLYVPKGKALRFYGIPMAVVIQASTMNLGCPVPGQQNRSISGSSQWSEQTESVMRRDSVENEHRYRMRTAEDRYLLSLNLV